MIFELIIFVVGVSAGFWLGFWLTYERREVTVERLVKVALQRPPGERQEKMMAIRAHIAARKNKRSE